MTINEIEEVELNRIPALKNQEVKLKEDNQKGMLNIVFSMVWTQVCGGSKIILEYANRLSAVGNRVTIITYDVKPTWFKLNDEVNFIQVPDDKEIKDYMPDCDIIVATSWKCIYTAIESQKAPVVFFEQGGAHLFDVEKIGEHKRNVVKNRFNMVPFVYTVSSYAKEIIKKEYGIDAEVIPIAIDENIFYPRKNNVQNENTEITIIGSEDFAFKNIDTILKAYRVLKEENPKIHLNWISQTRPQKNSEDAIINPPQIEIGEILRKTDIYICHSTYESFGLPTLEAMTCGAAIITTDTGGMRDFIKDGENGLITKHGDIDDIVEKIKILIENKEYRNKLVENAYKTAEKFCWDNSVKATLEYYNKISRYEVKKSANNCG